MKSILKNSLFLFAFNFLYWMGFTFITTDKGEKWNWLESIMFSAFYALMMTYMFSQKNKQLYLAADQSEGLTKYIKSLGYIEKKRKDGTIFFKKPGWSFSPFTYTAIKESPFYTLLISSDKVRKNVPEELERIRQPYTG